MDFKNRHVLITGGSSGIGLATAGLLAERGAHLWLVARNPARLEEARDRVRARCAGAEQHVEVIAADVADPTEASRILAHVSRRAGTPDVLINAAGVAHPGYFQKLDLAVFREAIEINYFGTLHMIKATVPGMIERRSGHIVNVCSLAGVLGVFGYSAYGPSKYAVRGLSDVLRAELRPHGIHVSIVYPPDTDTPQLAYENQFKPPETRALGGGVVLTPEAVAQSIITGIMRRRYAILPGLEAKLIYRLTGLLGDLQYPLMDWLIARAQRGKR